jgi:hypothetical protein
MARDLMAHSRLPGQTEKNITLTATESVRGMNGTKSKHSF